VQTGIVEFTLEYTVLSFRSHQNLLCWLLIGSSYTLLPVLSRQKLQVTVQK
jgi:hypothetical protein